MNQQANQPINLDIRCAELGQELANLQNMNERVLNEALAVLEEQGPYAMFLYIRARHDKIAAEFNRSCARFLQKVFSEKVQANTDVLDAVKKLANELDDLLFARDLLRNALAYAHCHLKAKESGS